jgi:hypothetical protein
MKYDDVTIGQPYCVKGYGGWATLLQLDELPYLSPANTPMYIATVKWGPNNNIVGRARVNPVEEFPLGRLEPPTAAIQEAHDEYQHANLLATINTLNEAQLESKIAELKAAQQQLQESSS